MVLVVSTLVYTVQFNLSRISGMSILQFSLKLALLPVHVMQSVARLTQEPEVQGSIAGQATYCCFSFRWFKKGSCQFLAKVYARSTG